MGKSSHHYQTLEEIERASNSLKVKEVSRCLISRESEHVFDDDAWRDCVAKLVMHSGPACHGTVGRTIYRVPEDIRGCDAKAYAPRAVCIGPYHYIRRDSEALRAMQDHKWRCVRYVVSRHRRLEETDRNEKVLLDTCLKRMTDLDEKVRRSYSDEIKEESHDLALMMLLDGCFILYCLLKQVEENRGEGEVGKDGDGGPLLRMPWIWNQVKHDLLLLENQIPFFVIQSIFDFLKVENDKGMDLRELALRLLGGALPQRMDTYHIPITSDEIHHLLHLVYLSILPNPVLSKPSTKPPTAAPQEWIPSATELLEAGVEIKKRKSTAASFLDIKFSNGVLEIPPLEVYDYSNNFFRNLIALEQCHPESQYYVTVYSAFMHCLINRSKDVRVLHRKGILVSRRGTSEEMTQLFSRLCYQVHYSPQRNYLGGLLRDVARYRKRRRNKCRKWWVRYVRDYLSNPLTIISIATGIFLLTVAAIQTFFAAYSYFLPPNKH